jgi:hypothetical protein
MNQTTTPNAQRELKLQKTTIVKLNMGKVGQLIRNEFQTVPVNTSASTLPQCDSTSATSLLA